MGRTPRGSTPASRFLRCGPSRWGFQFQVSQSSTIEASYVGSRSYNLNMNKDYNIPSLDVRKTCNTSKVAARPSATRRCRTRSRGSEAFNGTSYYTANTISRYHLTRPFPQFSGNLQQHGRNNSWIRYNSLQINYNMRMRGGLTSPATTRWRSRSSVGLHGRVTTTTQTGPYFLDRPQALKVTAIWTLPFGEGKKFGAGSNGIAKR